MAIGYLNFKGMHLKAFSIILIGILFTACQSGSKKTSASKEKTADYSTPDRSTVEIPNGNGVL